MLKKSVVALFFAGAIILAGLIGTTYSADVAFGKTVAAKGEFFTEGWGDGLVVDFSTLTDGVFFAKGHQWDQGPVWWDENEDKVQNSLTVFLGHTYYVQRLIIQVDNNDDYIISWQDAEQGYMEVKVIPDRHWGMDNPIVIEVEAITDAFKIEHDVNGAGDGFYSVSEFQAMEVYAITDAFKIEHSVDQLTSFVPVLRSEKLEQLKLDH